MSSKHQTRDPMKHKNGKPRLGPLNVRQLEDMLAKLARPRERNKIERRLRVLKSRPGYQAPVPAVETENEPS
jgi:hypothetical protein